MIMASDRVRLEAFPMIGGVPSSQPKVALAPFIADCPGVITLGVRPTLAAYRSEELALLRRAVKVYFPTRRFLGLFEAVAKPIFPSAASYHYQQSPILQQQLFRYLSWPAPSARIYFGERQKRRIMADFRLPVEVLGTVGGTGPAVCVETPSALERLVSGPGPVLIRQWRPWRKVVRCLAVDFVILGFQLGTGPGLWEPLTLDRQLMEPLEKSQVLINTAGLDDIVLKWGYDHGSWFCLGLGRPPRIFATRSERLDRHRWISRRIEQGRL